MRTHLSSLRQRNTDIFFVTVAVSSMQREELMSRFWVALPLDVDVVTSGE